MNKHGTRYTDLYSPYTTEARRRELEAYYRVWFGERVQQARKEWKTAQKEKKAKGTYDSMAEALGRSRSQVGKWCTGVDWGNPLVIARIAHVLHKPFNYFIHPDFRLPIENEEIERFLRVYEAGQAAATQVSTHTTDDLSHHPISVA